MMVEQNEELLLNEIKRLNELLEEKERPIVKTPEEYIQDLRLYGDVPKDQFSHQFKILFHPSSAPSTQMDLLPPDALLGLVKDSKTLRFLQNDNAILNRLYDLGLRNSGVMALFDSLYYSWWQQMRMTSTLGGNERLMQSFLEPSSVPYEGFSFLEKIQAKKKSKNRNYSQMLDRMQGNFQKRDFI